MTCKWHLGYEKRFNPVHHGFHRFRGFVSGNVDYISHVDRMGIADWWKGDELISEEGYSTYLITRHAVEFIEENKERPFCLYVAHAAPHSPYQGPKDQAIRAAGKTKAKRGRRDVKNAYREMMQALDDGIGRIVETVEGSGLAKSTLLFFFSDNGEYNRLGAVRHGKWKLVMSERRQADRGLYDLSVDIGEQNDLSTRYPERAQAMLEAFAAWKRDVAAGATVQPGRRRD